MVGNKGSVIASGPPNVHYSNLVPRGINGLSIVRIKLGCKSENS